MSDAPTYEIDLAAFHAEPFPDLARIQAATPIAFVPQLGATLITGRDTIYAQEKRIEVFSSYQPEGLMTRLMGENMMRKDGAPHRTERAQAFPALSPRTVRDHWTARFAAEADALLDGLAPRGACDLVADYAMPLSGHALRHMTGLMSLTWSEMDQVSQAMIDGISNYAADPTVEARCQAATARIDSHIDHGLAKGAPPQSLLAVLQQSGQAEASLRANIKLAISGGQNEPRDAIAGAAWAVLTHPESLAQIRSGGLQWRQVFEEYARWISPIMMSPRQIARPDTVEGVQLDMGDRVFLMFGAGNRDPRVFVNPERFDPHRDTGPSLSFGAGPHFCAGAAASRALIADVALPKLFDRFPDLHLTGEAPFAGWAFRGPLSVPVAWAAPRSA